ncbi:hypothetical protein ACLOJK_027225 [Asimina triloba]
MLTYPYVGGVRTAGSDRTSALVGALEVLSAVKVAVIALPADSMSSRSCSTWDFLVSSMEMWRAITSLSSQMERGGQRLSSYKSSWSRMPWMRAGIYTSVRRHGTFRAS